MFSATLRVGAYAGVNINLPGVVGLLGDVTDAVGLDVGAGISTGVYADVIESFTNITSQDGGDCAVHAEQAFSIAVGAGAGATAYWLTHTVGPTPSTHTPVWYTTMAPKCIDTRDSAPSIATSTAMVRRDDDEDTSVYSSTNTVVVTSGFGSNVATFEPISGSPTSYVPPGETSESGEGSASSSSGGTDTRLIIGLCVGLGVPALIAIVGTIM